MVWVTVHLKRVHRRHSRTTFLRALKAYAPFRSLPRLTALICWSVTSFARVCGAAGLPC